MPAFESSTGIPYPRVNLRHGLYNYEAQETCAAGVGTLLLEFSLLSRLSGDPKYEKVAKRALFKMWELRSPLDLMGNSLQFLENRWTYGLTGIGAGVDSFYEYLFKSWIFLGDQEYLDMFQVSYNAVMKHIKDSSGFIYKNVDMNTGEVGATWIDSLGAFFPGLQVLHGDLKNAIKHHAMYFTIWKKYGALPERFNWNTGKLDISYYPLRPELFESTYMLYQATKDPFYLYAGKIMLEDLEKNAKVKCGYATISNLESMQHDGRMESFFLSETLKYLYLLFDSGIF